MRVIETVVQKNHKLRVGTTASPGPQMFDAALERAWECFRLLEQHGDPTLRAFPDVRSHLRSAAHEGFTLDGKTLVAVRQTLESIRVVGAFFRRHGAGSGTLGVSGA